MKKYLVICNLFNFLIEFYFKKIIINKNTNNELSTIGIDIDEFNSNQSNNLINNIFNLNENIKFNIYDFGGQDFYKLWYPIFLSNCSIFLILYNIRNPNNSNIDYWIDSIKSKIKNPLILLIGTHKIEINFKPKISKENEKFIFNKFEVDSLLKI
jgi:GTPase SAR1 family protein